MKNITELFESIESIHTDTRFKENEIREKLTFALAIQWNDWSALQKAMTDAESASEYQWDQYGEIESWFRFSGLSQVEEREREFLEVYVSDRGLRIDWENECFLMSCGPSIVIHDDYRDQYVVDQDSGKVILRRDDYTDEDGQLDENLRNELIEKWMEKNGYFPGVFFSDYHGNVTLINTSKKA